MASSADTTTAAPRVFTVGHSNHPYERFRELLRAAEVTAIADVRSAPVSRRFPQFDKDALQRRLREDGIAYVFLGAQLGGRPGDPGGYRDGVADYERIAITPDFAHGIERVVEGARDHRIALMCAERDPLDCHRFLLVGRALAARGVGVAHILADGSIADHQAVEERLLEAEGGANEDLFLSREERLAQAYRRRARKVAHAGPAGGASPPRAAE